MDGKLYRSFGVFGETVWLTEAEILGIRRLEQPKPKKRKPRATKRVAEPSAMMTAAEAAALLGVSAKLVYRMFRDGELEGVKVRGAVRIHRASVDRYLSAHSNRKPAPPREIPAPRPTPRQKRRRRSPREDGFVHLRPQKT